MIKDLGQNKLTNQLGMWLVIAGVLVAAFAFGMRASVFWLALIGAGLGALLVLQAPALGLVALVVAALMVPGSFGTGTEVDLNLAVLLIPALMIFGILGMLVRGRISFAPSRTNLPLLLFLIAGLLSLFIGNINWDPLVPRKSNFTLVQLAQWGIFALSAAAYWLTANLVKEEIWLRRLTATFLLLAGSVAMLLALPGTDQAVSRFTTIAFIRAPLWMLLAALAGGQLLFNRLSLPVRLFLMIAIISGLIYVFVDQREALSSWVGVVAVLGMLLWLRFPRLRWLVIVLIVAMAATGALLPSVYDFAGGDAEWRLSGGTRIALSQRVIELTMRNPIFGLGPAAYRPYGLTGSLSYERLFYSSIALSAHNNYVDIFSHGGLLGMALFAWFVVELAALGLRLRKKYRVGFASGYVNSMLAAGVGALVIMMFADWILPFVYNIGFPGFQASVLVWLFMGGLVALDNMVPQEG